MRVSHALICIKIFESGSSPSAIALNVLNFVLFRACTECDLIYYHINRDGIMKIVRVMSGIFIHLFHKRRKQVFEMEAH